MVARIGTQIITAPGWTGQPRLDLGLIDCDVHQTIKSPKISIPIFPRVYRQQAIEQGIRLPGSGYFNVANDAARTDLADELRPAQARRPPDGHDLRAAARCSISISGMSIKCS